MMRKDYEALPPRHRHRRTIALSTITSTLSIGVVVFPLMAVALSPAIVKWLSTAMADEIRDQVQEQVTPVNAGLKALIENNIAELEDEIAALEYKRRTNPSFSELDNQLLTTKSRRLKGQRIALAALIEAEKARQK